jgi:hypothetical protein
MQHVHKTRTRSGGEAAPQRGPLHMSTHPHLRQLDDVHG